MIAHNALRRVPSGRLGYTRRIVAERSKVHIAPDLRRVQNTFSAKVCKYNSVILVVIDGIYVPGLKYMIIGINTQIG